jgi:hypothetical protein
MEKIRLKLETVSEFIDPTERKLNPTYLALKLQLDDFFNDHPGWLTPTKQSCTPSPLVHIDSDITHVTVSLKSNRYGTLFDNIFIATNYEEITKANVFKQGNQDQKCGSWWPFRSC